MIALSFPSSDSGLLAWSLNFLNLITATPTAYGLTSAQATTYGGVHAAYGTALAACDPASRNKSAVVTKNAAKATLKSSATLLANTIYGTSTVTDAQKTALGIPPRAVPAPVPTPSTSPAITVVSTSGWTAKLRLRDSAGVNRGKPPGTIGASIFSFVGAAAPTEIGAWKFEGSTGRVTSIDVVFANTLPAGTTVWFTAFWFNGRKQSGPSSAPISANLPAGSVAMAA